MTPPLTTPVAPPSLPFRLTLDDGIVSLGSCFADEIALRMEQSGFHVERNPFGTLYNPASMANALNRLIDDREIGPDDLVQHDGLWHSWHHHGSFSHPTAEEVLALCNNRIHTARHALRDARLLVVTFGTAWVFERGVGSGESGVVSDEISGAAGGTEPGATGPRPDQVVANCHKLPPRCFVRRRMTVGEIVDLWRPLLEKLDAFRTAQQTTGTELHTLFTVSPIRHMADGAHGNQLSKSTLLLAVDRLIDQQPRPGTLHYFPAYEIVLDELRDYRFYGPDMAHPTPLAADIVWDRFQQSALSPADRQQAHNNAKHRRSTLHQPLHPSQNS